MDVLEAYKAWQALFPGTIAQGHDHKHTGSTLRTHMLKGRFYKIPRNYDGRCCVDTHFLLRAATKRDMMNNPQTLYFWIAKPDSEVCERERAWRRYVSIRDNRSYHIGQLTRGDE